MTEARPTRITSEPAAWSWLTWTALGLCGVHLVLNLVAATLHTMHRGAIADAMTGDLPAIDRIGTLDSVLVALTVANIVFTVLGVLTLIAWAVVVRRTIRRYGGDPKLMRDRSFAIALLIVPLQWALNYMSGLTIADDNYQVVSDSARGADMVQVIASGLRITMALLLAYWLFVVRGRLQALIAEASGGPPAVALEPGVRGAVGRWRRSREERVYR
jgi:hypothetical protein